MSSLKRFSSCYTANASCIQDQHASRVHIRFRPVPGKVGIYELRGLSRNDSLPLVVCPEAKRYDSTTAGRMKPIDM